MRRKNIPPYDEEEQKLQMQSTAIVDFLRRKGAVPDTSINDEAVRKAHKDRAQRLYQNTEVLLNQYTDPRDCIGMELLQASAGDG